jgi:DNA-directed RNA polymerase I, II, and III subunit RPABC1
MSSDIIVKLWTSRNIILEVLSDRKYLITKSDFLTLDEFVSRFVNDKDESVTRKNMMKVYEKKSRQDKIGIIWPFENKLGTNIRDISLSLEILEIKRAIIIINDSVTPWGVTFIKNLKANKIYIDVYTLAESQFNVTKHFLVPTHIICTKIEKKKFLNSYSTTADKMPQIKQNDPIVRHFGASRGDLIKIIRNSETQLGLTSISYRIVS